jgi:DNA-binding IclR family transcriptional regulator
MPAQPSPVAARAARVLKVLADDPASTLGLSEVARRVGISRASCQTLLLALVDEGVVRRVQPGPTYGLGAVLVRLGEAARASMDVIDVAAAELGALRDRFEATAIVSAASGDEVVVLASQPFAHPHGYSVSAGTRLTLAAPVGPIYVAWADDAAVERWIDRADPALTATQRSRARADLHTIRERGWSATVRVPRSAGRDPHEVQELSERDANELRGRKLTVIGISSPVWQVGDAPACALALTAFPRDLTIREVRAMAAALKEAADHVTSQVGGKPR